jgi:hypothetical protein
MQNKFSVSYYKCVLSGESEQWTFGGFLHVPTTQIYCLTGALISETHIFFNNGETHNEYIFKTTMNDPPQGYKYA